MYTFSPVYDLRSILRGSIRVSGIGTFADLAGNLIQSSPISRGRTTLEPPSTSEFDQNLVVGAAAKEMVRALLESCGYAVLPFGYENVLAGVRPEIGDRERFGRGDLVERIRSMPDLLVLGEKELYLVEVKFRAGSVRRGYQRIRLSNWELARYQKYWPESVLTVVSPFRDGFHVQHVEQLSPRGELDAATEFSYDDFLPIEAIFKQAEGG